MLLWGYHHKKISFKRESLVIKAYYFVYLVWSAVWIFYCTAFALSPSPSPFSEEKEDPDKIDETEEIRVNGKEKTKDEFYFKETRYKNRPAYETYYLDGTQEQENSKLQIFKEKKDLFQFFLF